MHKLSLPANLDIVILMVLFCAMFFLVAPSNANLLYDPDFGSQITKGFGILNGRHPFVDIDSAVYGPAIFYVSALAQYFDDQRILSEIIIIFAGYFASYLMIFKVFKDQCRSTMWLLLFGIVCIIAFPRFHKYHVLIGPAVYFFCLHKASEIEKPVMSTIILAIGSVVAGVFRLDYGAYCVVSSTIYICLRYGREGALPVMQLLGVLCLTGLLLISPWLLYIKASTNLIDVASTIYKTSIGVYSGLGKPLKPYIFSESPFSTRNELFMIFWLLKLLPVLIVLIIFAKYVRRWKEMKSFGALCWDGSGALLDIKDIFLVVVAVAAFLFYLQASHRIDLSHLKQAFVPVFLLTMLALYQSFPYKNKCSLYSRYLVLFVILGIFIHGLVHPRLTAAASYSKPSLQYTINSWGLTKSELITQLSKSSTGSRKNYLPYALARVKELTTKSEPVLILPFMAQTYYYADRLFETPFGWLNPGRFIYPDTEKHFVKSMKNTSVIIDNPAFSFDGKSEGNIRAYAPLLTKHIYTNYGIIETIGPYVLLSNKKNGWSDQGVFQLKFSEYMDELSSKDEKYSAGKNDDYCSESGITVESINTLPIDKNNRSYTIPHAAGMLITYSKCSSKERGSPGCAMLGLWGNSKIYYVSGENNAPYNIIEIRPNHLIDTKDVEKGSYELVEIHKNNCDSKSMYGMNTIVRIEDHGIKINII